MTKSSLTQIQESLINLTRDFLHFDHFISYELPLSLYAWSCLYLSFHPIGANHIVIRVPSLAIKEAKTSFLYTNSHCLTPERHSAAGEALDETTTTLKLPTPLSPLLLLLLLEAPLNSFPPRKEFSGHSQNDSKVKRGWLLAA
ncbi:hypothetical protein CMV_024152 [Castanea mollissima]|uniref:Uncharacterized protein n=1 Tax=Castanea mollissima TaxID=60419 RepID=A0A8J4QHJ3_9ROSI|nr:hypothetical protein CMV_024152 [Castanea mollissima]